MLGKKRTFRRFFSMCLIISLMMSNVLVFADTTSPSGLVSTEETETDINDMNALDAIGIDTSEVPDGVDLESQDNPYGRDTMSINPVYELYIQEDTDSTLYGHNAAFNETWNEFYASPFDSKTSDTGSYAATASASGNFVDLNSTDKGKSAQVVTVGAKALSPTGGLDLYFTDLVNDVTSTPLELLSPGKTIGNNGNQMDEDFSSASYLLQNYLKIAAGDYDGDGMDEIAVYVAEQGNSRVEIYDLQADSSSPDDYYMTPANWKKAWTYNFNENPYVSNMVSLTSGDFNQDGTDDLGLTWGFYYGPDQFTNSKAIVLCGDSSAMLQKTIEIPLVYNNSPIVRAAFTAGDLDGDNVKDLVLGGQLNSDIANNNVYSRFVGVYTYNGITDSFLQGLAKNFDLFAYEEDDENNKTYENSVMADRGDIFYSLPTMVANISTFNMLGVGHGSNIYLDSLIISYENESLSITDALDQSDEFNVDINHLYPAWINMSVGRYYNELNSVSGDFTGDTKETLQVMINYAPESYDDDLPYQVPLYSNWFLQLITGFQSYTATEEVEHTILDKTVSIALQGRLDEIKEGDIVTGYDLVIETITDYVAISSSFCKLNTDNDTGYLSYKNKHGVIYSDPQVLSVLASAPYYDDLSSDALSGSYMESSTGYSSSTGSGSEDSHAFTIRAGAYVAFSHDFEIAVGPPGAAVVQKVAGMETELAYTAGFTYETTQASSMEMTVAYETNAGQDSVVFYSIPMEYYLFDSYTPLVDENDNIIGYDVQPITVNIPHTAAVVVLSLDKYEKIAADYDELPQISGEVLDHKVGDPATYPVSTDSYSNVIEYDGDWAGVDYSDVGASISQEINITSEHSDGFSTSHDIDFKIGAGPGDVIFGITVGVGYEYGKVLISSEGSAFTGTINNMPLEAEEFGYYYAWKLFTYTEELLGQKFPVVNYMVKDVTAPPKLPKDFAQDITLTSDESIGLSWSYPANYAVSGFQIYRYYEFPEGGGSYELIFVPASTVHHMTDDEDGNPIRHYQYVDEGLADYTDYDYQIQAIRAAVPSLSITSDILTARTKTNRGHPEITLNGVLAEDIIVYGEDPNSPGVTETRYSLGVYPDVKSTVSVSVVGDYDQPPKYQWQRLENGIWEDIIGASKEYYIFEDTGLSDEDSYRCRVNVIYEEASIGQNYYISAFSEPFELDYQTRIPMVYDAVEDDGDDEDSFAVHVLEKEVRITMASSHEGHTNAPTGKVNFRVIGKDYDTLFPVALSAPSPDYRTEAILDLDDLNNDGNLGDLAEGVYEISAYYGGSRVFSSLTAEKKVYYVVGSNDGYFLNIGDTYTYGDTITPNLVSVSKVNNEIQVDEVTTNVNFEVYERELKSEEAFVVIYVPFFTDTFELKFPYIRTWYEYVKVEAFGDNDTELPAIKAGEFEVRAKVDSVTVASRIVTIDKRDITMALEGDFEYVAGDSRIAHPTEDNLVVISNETLVTDYGDEVSSLGLEVLAFNTGGTEVDITIGTDPGHYLIVGAPKSNQTVDEIESYNNYNIRFIPNSYKLTGPKYDTGIVSEPFGSEFAFVGEVEIIDPEIEGLAEGTPVITSANNPVLDFEKAFASGSTVLFKATPHTGYQLKEWIVLETDTSAVETIEVIPANGLLLFHEMAAKSTVVTARFILAENRLYYKAFDPAQITGTVVAEDNAIESGALVQEGAIYTFIAIPAEGYHFTEWYLTGEVTDNFVGDLDPETGQSRATIAMGSEQTILTAKFTRDDYQLTLPTGLEATYLTEGGETTGIDNLWISGDTFVTVTPRAGYDLTDASWTINDTVVAVSNQTYEFIIVEDTVISVGTNINSYIVSKVVMAYEDISHSVVVNDTLNDVIIRVNNTTPVYSEPFTVSGSSKVEFIARPAWGYVFALWEMTENGDVVVVDDPTDPSLVIDSLGHHVQVTAVFEVNPDDYTVTLSDNDGGSLTYSIEYNGDGASDAPTHVDVPSQGEVVTVYEGDTFKLTATPDLDYMLRNWTHNNVVDETPSTSLIIDEISEDQTVSARFTPMSYTYVYYEAVGGGVIQSAKSNNVNFNSGDIVGNGTAIEIYALPDQGKMISYWTVEGDTIYTDYGTVYTDETLVIENLAADGEVMIVANLVDLDQYVISYDLTHTSVHVDFTPDSYLGATLNTDEPLFILSGTRAEITVIPENKYRIVTCTVNGSDATRQDNDTWTFEIDAATGPIDIVAVAEEIFEINILNTDPNGTVDISVEPEKIPYRAIAGETISLVDVLPALDYRLENWSVNGTDLGTVMSTTMPAEDIDVDATFARNPESTVTYNVFDVDGEVNGVLNPSITRETLEGTPVGGYSDNGTTITTNRGYSDAFNAWPNTVIEFMATPNEGYKVKYWYINGDQITIDTDQYKIMGNALILTLDENSLLVYDVQVQFDVLGEKITYFTTSPYGSIDSAVLTNEFGEETVVSSGDILTTSGSIQFEASVDSGYEIIGWYVNGSKEQNEGTTFTYSAAAGAGIDVTIAIERLYYPVSYDGDNGSVEAALNNQPYGHSPILVKGDSVLTFTATADPGYAFGHWTVDGEAVSESSEVLTWPIMGDINVMAHFIEDENLIINYTVSGIGGTLSASRDGSSFASGSLAASNDIIIFTAEPNLVSDGDGNNYRVSSWLVGTQVITGHETTQTLVVSEEIDVSVSFERYDFVVDYSVSGGNGTLESKDSGSYRVLKGENTILQASPAAGYQVKSWTVNGIETLTEDMSFMLVNMISNKTVVVEFEAIPSYTVTITTTGSGLGSVSAQIGSQPIDSMVLTVLRHSTITLTAHRYDESHAFNGWTVPNGVLYNDYGLEIVLTDITSDMVIEAEFNPAVMVELSASESDPNGTLDYAHVDVGYGDTIVRTVDLTATSVQVVVGVDATIQALPDSEFMVKEWLVNGNLQNELSTIFTLEMIDEDSHIEVVFEDNLLFDLPPSDTLYIVTTDERSPSDVGSDSQIRDRGTATFTITLDTDYFFSELTVEGVNILSGSSSPSNTTENKVSSVVNSNGSYRVTISNVRRNIVYTAVAVQPKITLLDPSHGTILATYMDGSTVVTLSSGNVVPVGTQLTLKATADSGYRFSGWMNSVSGSSSTKIWSVPKSNGTIAANFSVISSGNTGTTTGGTSRAPSTPTVPTLTVATDVIELETGSDADDDFRTYQLDVRTGGTNGEVIYTSSDITIVRVTKDGELSSVNFGNATIEVTVIGTDLIATIPVEVLLVGDEEPNPLGALLDLRTVENANELVNDLILEFSTTLAAKSVEEAVILLRILAEYLNDALQNEHVDLEEATEMVMNFIEFAFVPVTEKVNSDRSKNVTKDAFELSILAMNRLILKAGEIDLQDTLDDDTLAAAIIAANEMTDMIKKQLGSASKYAKSLTVSVHVILSEDVSVLTLSETQLEMLKENETGITVTKGDIRMTVLAEDLMKLNQTLEFSILPVTTGDKSELDMNENTITELMMFELLVTSGNKNINNQVWVTVVIDDVDQADLEQLMLGVNEEGKWRRLSYTILNNQLIVLVPHFSVFTLSKYEPAFADIEGNWANRYIKSLSAKGIVSGYDETTFNPDGIITRAEFVTMLVNYLALDDDITINFEDVEVGSWYYDHVARAGINSITAGSAYGKFRPNDPITREEMAVMIVSAYKVKYGFRLVGQPHDFDDAGMISAYALEAIYAAKENGIISGYPDNTFKATANATRAEASTMLFLFLEK